MVGRLGDALPHLLGSPSRACERA